MEYHKELLHVRFAEEVMGWSDVEPSREGGSMRLYGTVHTNRGPQRREVPDAITKRRAEQVQPAGRVTRRALPGAGRPALTFDGAAL